MLFPAIYSFIWIQSSIAYIQSHNVCLGKHILKFCSHSQRTYRVKFSVRLDLNDRSDAAMSHNCAAVPLLFAFPQRNLTTPTTPE